MSFASDKVKLLVFLSRTNLKLHNIFETPKMIEKIITILDSSKAARPDCISVMVVKNCEPERSYIIAEFLNMCLKECYFPDCWKVSLVVPVSKNVGKRSTVKTTALLVLLLCLVKCLKNM